MSFFFLHQDQGDKVAIATPDTGGTPFCHFEDVVMEGGRRATVLRENPVGRELPIGDPKEVQWRLKKRSFTMCMCIESKMLHVCVKHYSCV